MSALTCRDAGDSMLLVELEPVVDREANRRAWALAQSIERLGLAGLRAARATFRSVAVDYDPLRLDRDRLVQDVLAIGETPLVPVVGRVVSVPVVYGGDDGPDLAQVAARSGLSAADVVHLHAEPEYHAFLVGFMPGFAYLGPTDARLVAPRRQTPRVRVAAGSVGMAGRQTGVYPMSSPGGWALLGRTSLEMFDPTSSEPCRIRPGDRVRFVPVERLDEAHTRPVSTEPDTDPTNAAITVVQSGLLTTIQDHGRYGFEAAGVSPGGGMDKTALGRANVAVGNEPDAAAIEATLAGLDLRLERNMVVAIAGADLGARLDGMAVPLERPVPAQAGARLRLTDRRAGARAYVAFSGGLDVPIVMGSRSTDLGSGFGGYCGRALRAGDRLACLDGSMVSSTVAEPNRERAARAERPAERRGDTLRVLPGPHREWFAADALDLLQRTRYRVSPQSNRVGYRLTSSTGIGRVDDGEMISDATVVGGIQVPADGQPILLMVDRHVTGGYPMLAAVISADIDVAAQLAPGDEVSFRVCSREEALEALAEARSPW